MQEQGWPSILSLDQAEFAVHSRRFSISSYRLKCSMALRSLAFVFAAISVSGAEQCEGPGSAQGSAGSALLQSSYGHATKSFSGPNMTLIQQQGNQLAEAAKSNSGNLQFMFCCLGLSSWFNYCVEFSGCEVPVTDSCWCVGKYQEGEEDCRTHLNPNGSCDRPALYPGSG